MVAWIGIKITSQIVKILVWKYLFSLNLFKIILSNFSVLFTNQFEISNLLLNLQNNVKKNVLTLIKARGKIYHQFKWKLVLENCVVLNLPIPPFLALFAKKLIGVYAHKNLILYLTIELISNLCLLYQKSQELYFCRQYMMCCLSFYSINYMRNKIGYCKKCLFKKSLY